MKLETEEITEDLVWEICHLFTNHGFVTKDQGAIKTLIPDIRSLISNYEIKKNKIKCDKR